MIVRKEVSLTLAVILIARVSESLQSIGLTVILYQMSTAEMQHSPIEEYQDDAIGFRQGREKWAEWSSHACVTNCGRFYIFWWRNAAQEKDGN